MSEVISGYLIYSLAVVAIIVIFGGGVFSYITSFGFVVLQDLYYCG